jgi:hypothetical protein
MEHAVQVTACQISSPCLRSVSTPWLTTILGAYQLPSCGLPAFRHYYLSTGLRMTLLRALFSPNWNRLGCFLSRPSSNSSPLGFDFQRFPPPSSRHASRRALPFLLFLSTPKRRTAAPRIDAPGRSVHDGPVLPGVHRSSLSKPVIPPRVSPLGPWLHASTKPPLMGFSATLSVWPHRYRVQAPSRRDRPSPRLLYRVSKSPRVGLPLSRAASLPGIRVLPTCRSKPFGLPVAALLRPLSVPVLNQILSNIENIIPFVLIYPSFPSFVLLCKYNFSLKFLLKIFRSH